DPRWGGFGGAPKFPQPVTLEFVLRQAIRGTPDALEMAVLTLDRMAGGGMFDQVGGGFARYSTDAAWMVPHFEKMLYDNAQLALLYARAWLVTRNDHYRDISSRTLDYLLREMRHPEGGFFSSQDADSEGVEGKFFVWSWDELVSLVGEEAAGAFLTLYETTADLRWFVAARASCDTVLDLFADQERGGFFQTGSDAGELVVRPKDLYDNAVPSGNSAAAEALLRLALFTGEGRYEDAAIAALRLVRGVMRSAPGGFGETLCALDLYLGPSHEVAIVGDPDASDTRALVDEVLRAHWRPN